MLFDYNYIKSHTYINMNYKSCFIIKIIEINFDQHCHSKSSEDFIPDPKLPQLSKLTNQNFDNSIRNDNNPSLPLHIKFEVFKTIPKLNPNTLHYSKHHLKASTAISLLSEVISPEHFSQISLHYAHHPPATLISTRSD